MKKLVVHAMNYSDSIASIQLEIREGAGMGGN
jgi:hypothetical protein